MSKNLRPALAERIEVWPIDRLRPYEKNPRTHSPAQVDELAASIVEFGFVNPVLVDTDSGVIAGHGRLKAARKLGLEEVPVVVLDHLDERQRRAYLLADNRLAELSGWDDELLAGELRELASAGLDLAELPLGFSHDDLEGLGLELDAAAVGLEQDAAVDRSDQGDAGGGDADDVEQIPKLPKAPTAELGDVFHLGPHRVTCGDCLEPETIERIFDREVDAVITDPPYAIYGSSTGVSVEVTDDAIVRPFFRSALRVAEGVAKKFALVYVFCDWRSWPAIHEGAKGGMLVPKNLLVWHKGQGLGNVYMNSYELVAVFSKAPKRKVLTGQQETGQRQVLKSNVIDHKRVPSGQREHFAAKPVGLLSGLLADATDEEPVPQIVADLFLGGGSTLIAAEQTGRACFGVEKDPRYIDVTIARWQRLTHKAAVHVETGKTFNQLREARRGPGG